MHVQQYLYNVVNVVHNLSDMILCLHKCISMALQTFQYGRRHVMVFPAKSDIDQ